MHAIQEKLDNFEDDGVLSDDHIAFVKERIHKIQTSNQPTYTWQQVKGELKNRRNMR